MNKALLNKRWRVKNKAKVLEINRAWRSKNKEAIKAKRKIWQEENANKPSVRYSYLRGKCKYHNLELSLTLEDCILFWNKNCHYCKSSILKETGAGLDRINNDKGYIKTNVLPCCGTCNLIRGYSLTVDEMEIAMDAILLRRLSQYS